MELYLIRHGDTLPGKKYYSEPKKALDPPLNSLGWDQADRLGKRLENVPIDAIYCSDLERAVSTAKILGVYVQSKVIVEPALREIDMGDIQLHDWEEYPELRAQWKRHETDMPYPNGENGQDVWNRCRPVIESITKSNMERVAVVIHGGVIRCLLSGIFKIPFHERFYLGSPLHNCSITALTYESDEGRFYLNSFREHAIWIWLLRF